MGFTAAFKLGIREDIGLLVAALVGAVMLVARRVRGDDRTEAAR